MSPKPCVLLSIALALGACAASPAPASRAGFRAGPANPPTSPAPARAEVGLRDTDWAEVISRRFFLAIPLPARRSWSVDDHGGPWLVARHPASESELIARTWSASRLARPEECEVQARLWRPDLPRAAGDAEVDHRTLDVPDGYRTELSVAVQRRSPGIEGFALAFGATVGRCLAVVYTTRARGPGAEDVVGRRLAIAADGIVSRVRSLGIEDRVRP